MLTTETMTVDATKLCTVHCELRSWDRTLYTLHCPLCIGYVGMGM